MPSLITIIALLLPLAATQNLGNPFLLSSYPLCAAECETEIQKSPVACPDGDRVCQCSPTFQATAAACNSVSCSPAEYDKTSILARQYCADIFANGTQNPTSVSAAIASSTSAAAAAVASKDVTDPASYPPCGQACINKYLPLSGCGSLNNRTCICTGRFNTETGPCELATCSKADITIISYLAYELCNSAGVGIGNTTSIVNQTITSEQTSSRGVLAPTGSPLPFTGGAASLRAAWMLFSGLLLTVMGSVVLV